MKAQNLHLAEHHLFELFGKRILFNVETMLYYEVTPVVSKIIMSFEKSPDADFASSLKKNTNGGKSGTPFPIWRRKAF